MSTNGYAFSDGTYSRFIYIGDWQRPAKQAAWRKWTREVVGYPQICSWLALRGVKRPVLVF
jgi:hypothetical protein